MIGKLAFFDMEDLMRSSFRIVAVFFLLSILWSPVARSQYANFDECVDSEFELLADLTKAKSEGRDLREYLEERTGKEVDSDGEYLLWLFETRPIRTLSIVMLGKCALRYPDSSPFSEEDLAKMRAAEQQAKQKLRE